MIFISVLLPALAGLDRKVDAVVGQATWVRFGDTGQLQACGLWFGHVGVR
jgi:hypothetical protein